MKITALVCIACLTALTTAFRSDAPTAQNRADYATVYIYRTGQFVGSGTNFAIFANGEKVCKLSNNRYIEYKAKPGKLNLSAHVGGIGVFKKETGFDLDVEAGKSYYVKGDQKSSFTRVRMDLSEVTENTAKRDMANMTVDACQDEK